MARSYRGNSSRRYRGYSSSNKEMTIQYLVATILFVSFVLIVINYKTIQKKLGNLASKRKFLRI